MNKKVQNAWAFYDWANSVYSLVISTAVFPIYFAGLTTVNEQVQSISLGGREILSSSLYSYTLSLSFLLVAIFSPFLSGIADHIGKKKRFLQFFCYLGSLSCMGLYFFTDLEMIWYGLIMSILASIGFWGSLVFYNAFLPEIAPPEKQDRLSARGFALGYLGAALLLIINLAMIMTPDTFGLESAGQASRISFLMVGLWWAGFAQITFRRLPDNVYRKKSDDHYIWNGYAEIKKVFLQLKDQNSLRRFLYSFFLYSMGVQTVMYMATMFGKQELRLDTSKLITTILIIQFVGIGGAFLFAWISRKIGNLQSIKISILIWILVCYGAYTLHYTDPGIDMKFYLIGGMVGLVMGGIQAISRSTYSKLLPATESHASYFSFYDVSEKIAIVLGTLVYGLLIQLTGGSMKLSALALALFFIAGFLLLLRVRKTPHVR